jgi:DNA-binding transcriptional regulator YiaG
MNGLLATMHPAELIGIMREIGCRSDSEMARKIGVSRCTVYLWRRGGAIPRPTAMLLRILARQAHGIAA